MDVALVFGIIGATMIILGLATLVFGNSQENNLIGIFILLSGSGFIMLFVDLRIQQMVGKSLPIPASASISDLKRR